MDGYFVFGPFDYMLCLWIQWIAGIQYVFGIGVLYSELFADFGTDDCGGYYCRCNRISYFWRGTKNRFFQFHICTGDGRFIYFAWNRYYDYEYYRITGSVCSYF